MITALNAYNGRFSANAFHWMQTEGSMDWLTEHETTASSTYIWMSWTFKVIADNHKIKVYDKFYDGLAPGKDAAVAVVIFNFGM